MRVALALLLVSSACGDNLAAPDGPKLDGGSIPVVASSIVPDDTWIDFAQAPFALLACVATAAFARRAGSPSARAVSFGLALLGVPLVMLQLATNYVDARSALDAVEASGVRHAIGFNYRRLPAVSLMATPPVAPFTAPAPISAWTSCTRAGGV